MATAVQDDAVRRAMEKDLLGEPLTGEEERALRKWEKAQREEQAWACYAAVPKKHYREMSGRQDKILNEQAERYGLNALLGPTVDLRVLLRQFHDFLAKNWMRFEKDIEEEAILSGGATNTPNMERYRGYKADLAKLEVEERNKTLLPRAEMRAGMLAIAGTIRSVGERLDREYGPDARGLLEEALNDAAAAIDQLFPQ